jgi:hypothetical protein
VDSGIPTGTRTAALGSRWADDQPTAHGSGSSSFNVGDTVYAGNALWRCKVAHTRDVANTPVTGGSAGTYWESANLWLRVEREAGTTWVRFLYAVASTESEASSRWRPILAEPGSAVAGRAVSGDARELRFDLARWFRATTVSTAMTSSTTAITLAAASGWKANVGDVLAIDNELVTVTSASADGLSLTISRATDGTTAATHAANSRITSAAYRGDDLLIGTCVNSGKTGSFSTFSAADFATLQVGNLKVENHNLASTDPDYDVDATDWEATTGDPTTAPTDDTKYLASQYQVFFGPYDITEDFFMYGQATSQRLAREDWIYNPREFWSQSRWWDDGTEKDPGYVLPTLSALTNREIWAKSTLLTLDMRQLQDYLRTRTLASAAESRLDGGYDSPIGAPATVLRTYLPDNGLIIHVSRTNRYPWNPEHKGKNPFNPALPNENTLTRTTASLAAEGDTDLRTSYFNAQVATMMATSRAGGWQLRSTLSTTDQSDVGQRLQPWTLATTASPGALMYAPPIKPQDFHHGVRLVNGRSIDWNHDATNGAASGGDDFGTSKLLIVTPNHIYIQGDFNSTPQPVNDGGVACSKSTPTAVYGDSVTFLSNAWSPGDLAWRIQGLAATHNAITAGGTLAYGQGPSLLPKASATTYACAVLTHNLPTTRSRVAMGEASALDDNLLVLEDWATISQTFIGSIVVMDTRRYTDAYRLDQLKTAGLTPFGFIGATTWNSVFTGLYARNEAYGNSFAITTGRVFTGLTGADGQRWAGQISQICGIPNRELFYNPDFKTKEGTPPEMPFGIKTVGVGGWMRVLR